MLRSELGQELQAEGPQGVPERQGDDRPDVGDDEQEEPDAAGHEPGSDHGGHEPHHQQDDDQSVSQEVERVVPEKREKELPRLHGRDPVLVHERRDEARQEKADIGHQNGQDESQEPRAQDEGDGQVPDEPPVVEVGGSGEEIDGQRAEDGQQDKAISQPPHEQRIPLPVILLPRAGHLGLVPDDVVEEHEGPSRADPGQGDEQDDEDHRGDEDGDGPSGVVHEPRPASAGEVQEFAEGRVLARPRAGRAIVELHEPGQEGVEADDQPFVEVERLEQGLFHPAPGPAERFYESNGHEALLSASRDVWHVPLS